MSDIAVDRSGNVKALNISTRLQVQSGDNALIGGLIVTGTGGKRVIIRALGPSLGTSGVQGALQDPVLELDNSSGTFVTGNDNWKSQNQAGIEATGIPPSDDHESALVITLGAGNWTAVTRPSSQDIKTPSELGWWKFTTCNSSAARSSVSAEAGLRAITIAE